MAQPADHHDLHTRPEQASRPEATGDCRDGPAADLGEVWDLLDCLPTVPARIDLAATTVDLVAAKVAGGARPGAENGGIGRRWGVPLLAVAVALATGVVAGRITAPDPDRQVLESLPLIENFDLLREAGSVAFLEALANRMAAGQGPPPRWLRFGRDPEALHEEAQEFDKAIESLAAAEAAGNGGEAVIAARRERILGMPVDARSRLERAVDSMGELSRIERRDLVAVARVLADPRNDRARDAARLWHVIVAATPPPMRRGTIEMTLEDRLEWLGRFDPRSLSRRWDDGRDRREGEGREQPRDGWNGPRRPGRTPGPPLRGSQERPARTPRPADDHAAGPGPRSVRPPGPPPASGPREVPEETRALPR
ncbi:MAG: hypothetical protein O3C39_00420 [Planctomycetota bacterium]|nr:hypothetical protein [Planctomycetota bacterium]